MTTSKMDQISESLSQGYFPQWAYSDEELYNSELEEIFGETWCFIGHETEIPDPGDYVRRYIGEDPFIFIRDEDGDVRVFFNSCRHRGATLCQTESGNASHFRCSYHGWTFNNSGNLVGVPQKHELYEGLDTEEWGLFEPPRVDSYRGLVFASLNEDIPSLETYLGDLAWYFDIVFGLTEEGMEVVGEPHRVSKEYNWKSGVENSCSDNYHFVTTHQSAVEAGAGSEEVAASDVKPHPFAHISGAAQASLYMRHDPPYDMFFGYTDLASDNLNPELSEEQIEIARNAVFFNCAVFPNMTVVLMPAKASPEKPAYPVLFVRLHKPLGEKETESWRWCMMPKETPEEDRRDITDAFMASFGSSGIFVADDQAAWERVTQPTDSVFADKFDVQLNYEVGKEEMSGDLDIYEEWPGPGEVTDGQMIDLGLRKFHKMWYNSLTGEASPHEAEVPR